jgi:hypothetical protein
MLLAAQIINKSPLLRKIIITNLQHKKPLNLELQYIRGRIIFAIVKGMLALVVLVMMAQVVLLILESVDLRMRE